MNRIYAIIFLVWSCFFVVAQAGDDEEFFEKVRASGVVNDNESILLSSNVYFYPNKKGHGVLSGGGSNREKGHIVFTENMLSVISWSRRNKAYEVIHQESYSELTSTDISGNAPMVRLVTQSKESGKYNSYELMDSKNAFTPNSHKTKEARSLIKAGIEGLDVKEVATVKDLSSVEVAMQKQRMQELEERIQRLENGSEATPSSNQQSESGCDCKCAK
ncbi:MAG: hypothetical protein AB8B89_06405 [Gammaproteobacteria bacterium]